MLGVNRAIAGVVCVTFSRLHRFSAFFFLSQNAVAAPTRGPATVVKRRQLGPSPSCLRPGPVPAIFVAVYSARFPPDPASGIAIQRQPAGAAAGPWRTPSRGASGASGSGTGPGAQRSPTLRGGRRPDLFSSSSAARCSPRRAACLAALLASPRCSALLASRHGLAVVRQQRHRRLVQLLGLLPRAAADIRVRACVRACARATALCHAVAHDAALMAPRRPEVVWAPLA